MTRGVLRFFFDYGAGGCLWAGDDQTRSSLGLGPLDAGTFALDGRLLSPVRLPLPVAARRLRDHLGSLHAGYLNPLSPTDPSLWSRGLCERFNADVDRLLMLLRQELGRDYTIRDEQPRYAEDPGLADYLTRHPGLAPIEAVTAPSVGRG